MNFLIFDCETTGLPKRYNARWDDLNNWPRLAQFAFLLINDKGHELDKFEGLINQMVGLYQKKSFSLIITCLLKGVKNMVNLYLKF